MDMQTKSLRVVAKMGGGRIFASLVAVLAGGILHARTVAVPPQPVSPYLDTEVSTNIAFGASYDVTREIVIRFALDEGCSSNCLQVAFGRDADHDGVLSLDETETLYGWRNGRCFAESVKDGVRLEEPADNGPDVDDCTLYFDLAKNRGLRGFAATNETGVAVFTNLTATTPDWLYRPDWNLMRVTRRGPGVPAEWFSCSLRSYFLYIYFR